MFKSNKEEVKSVPTGTIDTLISKSCQIEGNIKSENSIKVDGQITGKLDAKGTVIIAAGGIVTGDIKADNLIVYGHLVGDSTTQSIHIQDKGRIEGNIDTQSLHVEPSATYQGVVSMSSKADTPASTVKDSTATAKAS